MTGLAQDVAFQDGERAVAVGMVFGFLDITLYLL